MYRKIIRNEQGDLSFLTIFIILAITMLMSFLLLFASVKINCMNIRHASKMELNYVSARISADTFHSQRETNLGSYMADLHQYTPATQSVADYTSNQHTAAYHKEVK